MKGNIFKLNFGFTHDLCTQRYSRNTIRKMKENKEVNSYYENNEILPSGIIVEKQNNLFTYNDICKITFQIRLNRVVS